MLPLQLRKSNFGFVKLSRKTKIPFEKEWQNKPYDYNQIQEWFQRGFNYGVICGIGDLVVLDADSDEISKIAFEILPATFTVKTTTGYHFYFICKAVTKKLVLSKDGKHYGEIVSSGGQVVGPGSIHPTGAVYIVERDVPIQHI